MQKPQRFQSSPGHTQGFRACDLVRNRALNLIAPVPAWCHLRWALLSTLALSHHEKVGSSFSWTWGILTVTSPPEGMWPCVETETGTRRERKQLPCGIKAIEDKHTANITLKGNTLNPLFHLPKPHKDTPLTPSITQSIASFNPSNQPKTRKKRYPPCMGSTKRANGMIP